MHVRYMVFLNNDGVLYIWHACALHGVSQQSLCFIQYVASTNGGVHYIKPFMTLILDHRVFFSSVRM